MPRYTQVNSEICTAKQNDCIAISDSEEDMPVNRLFRSDVKKKGGETKFVARSDVT